MNLEANEVFYGGQLRKWCNTSQMPAANLVFAGDGHSTLVTLTFGIRQPPEDVSVQYTVMILFGFVVVSYLIFDLMLFLMDSISVSILFR
jgi:hypothetical protein